MVEIIGIRPASALPTSPLQITSTNLPSYLCESRVWILQLSFTYLSHILSIGGNFQPPILYLSIASPIFGASFLIHISFASLLSQLLSWLS